MPPLMYGSQALALPSPEAGGQTACVSGGGGSTDYETVAPWWPEGPHMSFPLEEMEKGSAESLSAVRPCSSREPRALCPWKGGPSS